MERVSRIVEFPVAFLATWAVACGSSPTHASGWGYEGEIGSPVDTGLMGTGSSDDGSAGVGSSSGGSTSGGTGSSSGTAWAGGSNGGSGTSTGGGSSGGNGLDAGGSGSGGSSSGDAGAVSKVDSGTSSGAVDAGAQPCKRGIASNAAPSSAFLPAAGKPGITWWYDWGNQPSNGAAPGLEFTPMIWGASGLKGPIPAASRYVLGFNEPNFKNEANLTPQQAAADWPSVEALAKAKGIPIVSPAVNFCGECTVPSITDPYTYLKDFFAACSGCEVDYIAVHWYNCDLPSLQGYIEGNGSGLQGFVQFGKPIWLTEFACDNSHSVADQRAYMQAAVPYLEANPHIYRYSWFNATPIPNALLMNSNGTLTSLGATYVSLPASCN